MTRRVRDPKSLRCGIEGEKYGVVGGLSSRPVSFYKAFLEEAIEVYFERGDFLFGVLDIFGFSEGVFAEGMEGEEVQSGLV